MKLRTLAVLLVLSLLCNGLAWAEVRIYFSPNGGCDQAVVQLAGRAQSYLDAACYTFTLNSIADQLLAAKRRGVWVRVIVDKTQASQQSSQAQRLAAAGIPVLMNSHSGLMHDKFLVVDGRSVATGSFNWTASATQKNDENLVVFADEPPVAKAFAGQFDRMWRDSTRFRSISGAAPVPTKSPRARSAPSPQAPSLQTAQPAHSDTVYITSSGTKYHRLGCRYLKKGGTAISRADAESQGYAPCSVCKP
jgi:phosphatidylserine/phosphatidylglycerophosphate/cardiolipin synthase-like enzyme